MPDLSQTAPAFALKTPPTFRAEAVHRLYLGIKSVAVFLPLLPLLLVLGLWSRIPSNLALLWLLAGISMPLAQYLLGRAYFRATLDVNNAPRWGNYVTMTALIDGIIWGTAGIAFYIPNEAPQQLLLLALIIGIPAGSIFSTSWWPATQYVNAGASVGLTAIGLLSRGSTDEVVMGMALLLYLVILHFIMREAHGTAMESIALRFENHELIKQLQHEKEIAERANLAKSKFLAAASHDLRQPIHAQGLFLEVLSRTEQTPHQRELIASARSASEAAGELLNALLDFSRIEADVIEPNMQAIRLQPLLHKIENELAPQADAKNLVYRSRETQAVVHTDPVLLELILRNLVSNAIRYTVRGGVLVGCRQQGSHIVLGVWDTGIGIAQEHQKEVFREFHQLGNPERDRNKGLGLGLAIAEGLARTLGHGLSLTSVPQQGSVFRLTLPVDNSIQLAQVTMTQSRTRILNAKLLIVDDDKIVRESMLHLLRDWGCECEAAETIEEALALARLHRPDAVISDYRLREQRTGVEAIAALRALLGESLPALLITGDTAPERLREAQASGIPLLHKPVSPGKLYRRLVELLQELV